MFSTYQQTRDWNELQKAIDASPEIPPCTNDPEAWFPEPGGQTRIAVDLCRKCPVVQQCAEYAIAWEFHGIWGGLTGQDRIKLRRGKGIKSNPLTRESVTEPLESPVDPFFDSYFGEVS